VVGISRLATTRRHLCGGLAGERQVKRRWEQHRHGQATVVENL
jgi:hypothetical protein